MNLKTYAKFAIAAAVVAAVVVVGKHFLGEMTAKVAAKAAENDKNA